MLGINLLFVMCVHKTSEMCIRDRYGANNPVNTIDINGDSLLIVTPAAIEAIYIN